MTSRSRTPRQSVPREAQVSEDHTSQTHGHEGSPQRSETPPRFLRLGTPLHSPQQPGSSSGPSQNTPTMAEILKALDDARAEIADLRRERDAPQRSMTREVKIGQPACFDGKVSEYTTFMSQCQLHFTVYPDSFVHSESKVLFIISFLSGNARSWANDILTQENHPLRRNYDAFKRALDALYLDRNLRHQARDKLSRLRQTKSAAAYSVEFQQIITPLKLDNNAKCIFFYIGLKDTIKDALATIGESDQFEELADQAIAIDQRQHQRRMEEKKTSSKPANPDRVVKNENGKRPASAPPSRSSTPAPGPKSGNPDKGQPRPPVSETEKQRRRKDKLCFYCGNPNHRIENCPDRPEISVTLGSSAQVPQYSFPSVSTSEN